MRRKIKSVEIRIAIFAIAGLFLMVWGINFLKGIDIFKKQYTYYAIFDNTSGLLPSHTVTVNGLSVGLVDKIELTDNSTNKILVTLDIDKKIKIPVNSVVRIITLNPLSSPQVEIVLGNESEYIQEGDTIPSAIQPSMFDGLDDIMSSLKNILVSLDTSIKNFTQAGAFDDAAATLKNLHATTNKIDNLLAVNTNKINGIVTDVEAFTNTIHEKDEKIGSIIDNLNTVSEDLAEAELKKTIYNTKNAIGRLDSLLTKVNQGEGSLGQLVTNDSLYIGLQNSMLSLDKLLEDIRANPKKYINVTVFGKKEKKK